MIELTLTADDLARVRFAFSPVWETVTSIRALSTNASSGLHLPWLRTIKADLAGLDLGMLTGLVPPTGYIPDFLTPTLPRRTQSFENGLAAVADTPPATVAEELGMLANADDPALRDLRSDPVRALDRITSELERYWKRVIEPFWPRIRALHQADLAYRMDIIATGGVEELLRTLHPMVGYDGSRLTIHKPYCGQAPLEGRGLLLVPCVFAWPKVMVLTSQPYRPTITYSPRGIGRLWESSELPAGSPLGELIGRTRAAILAQLDVPMTTTQLSRQLDLTAPTLSSHLQILKSSGVVSARRDGRSVLYDRTSLGTRLLGHSAGAVL